MPDRPTPATGGSGGRPRVAIQVVLHRSAARLGRLLTALDRLETGGLDVAVRFLNNTPGDGSAEVLAGSRLRLPHEYHDSSDGNIGFGAGHNLLARMHPGGSDHLLLLNPDTIPFHDVLTRLVEAAAAAPEAALVEAAQFPIEHQKQHDPQTGDTNWCCGACLLVRTEAFESLGGFDEQLFLYCEDVDLSWRAWAAGLACRYVPEARCCHVSQEEDPGKDRRAEIHHMHLGDLYLRRKWFDEDEVNAHVRHLEVWVGPDETARLLAELDRISPPAAAPARPPQAMLMSDHINYAPARW